jgi:oxygen-independent coproporphyrinogen-3 oxidase
LCWKGNVKMEQNELIKKYNVPVPRYTSYPTVPMWHFDEEVKSKWLILVRKIFEETNEDKGISLYLHLPFCERLCTYCGCNKHITVNHTVEIPYTESIVKEYRRYAEIFGKPARITEMHLGGGTPTFFSPENLELLIGNLLSHTSPSDVKEYSFEGHPNSTTYDHLKALHHFGFNRVSFGVQDFSEKVQKAINRIQPLSKVVEAVENARKVGYESVNFDLIFGLPFQTEKIITDTFNKVLALRPERIAYYSYAHVPWKSPSQRGYDENDLPDNELKRKLYDIGKEMLIQAGYEEVGMDHFALKHDQLYKAYQKGQLHRNFMGYTVSNTDFLLGLGASSISDAKYAYIQNEKKVKPYQHAISEGAIPIINGHVLTSQDLDIKAFIKSVICNGEADWNEMSPDDLPDNNRALLLQMQNEGLVGLDSKGIKITEKGKPFIRNICNVFDLRHWASKSEVRRYSKSI